MEYFGEKKVDNRFLERVTMHMSSFLTVVNIVLAIVYL